MKTLLHLKQLELEAVIGVTDQERQKSQKIWIDLSVEIEVKEFLQDSLEQSVDYVQMLQICEKKAKNSYHLIEALAEAIANAIMEVPKVCAVKVHISKPEIFPNVIPAVTLERP